MISSFGSAEPLTVGIYDAWFSPASCICPQAEITFYCCGQIQEYVPTSETAFVHRGIGLPKYESFII